MNLIAIGIVISYLVIMFLVVRRERQRWKKEVLETEPEEDSPPGADDLEEFEVNSWYDEKVDLRADIDTAIAVYNLLGEMDLESTDIIRWGMRNKLRRAKKQCLEMICESVKNLSPEDEEDSPTER